MFKLFDQLQKEFKGKSEGVGVTFLYFSVPFYRLEVTIVVKLASCALIAAPCWNTPQGVENVHTSYACMHESIKPG